MKGVLIDENLPSSIHLPTTLPVYGTEVLGVSPSDSRLWEYARSNELVILTKDTDFRHRILLATPPPWIVHIRLGNLPLRDFVKQIVSIWPSLETRLLKSKLISVFADRIEAVE